MITRNTDYSIQRLRGLSTDTKPVNVPNGSSGGGGIMIVRFGVGDPITGITADKTFAEVSTAVEEGDCVFGVLQSGNVYPLRYADEMSIVFANVTVDFDGKYVKQEKIIIDSNNVCSMAENVYPKG